MSQDEGKTLLLNLYKKFADFQIKRDPSYNHLSLGQLFSETWDSFPVAESIRRQVYCLKSSYGTFYLKYSPLNRKKDQRRFLFLPWRISAEWNNLQRLKKKNIPTATPVFFARKNLFPCQGFFVLTEDVNGGKIDCSSKPHLFKLAQFIAYLHKKGVLHTDLHPENILIQSSGDLALIDAQEVYFLPFVPRFLKKFNLGQLWRYIAYFYSQEENVLDEFLEVYNSEHKSHVSTKDVTKIAKRCHERYYISRCKRCLKNSTEFQVIKKEQGIKGFKRRDFAWKKDELHTALAKGKYIKDNKLLAYKDVCIKIHTKRFFHKDRCLISWKMARALEVRGVKVPQALAYYNLKKHSYFLCHFYQNSLTLNNYLSTCLNQEKKRKAIQKLADWIRNIHDLKIWQQDFKSSNVLVYNNQFIMLDLEGVKIGQRLSWEKRAINLAQLNASISNILTLKDRLRFFHLYCGGRLPPRKRRRKIYQKIWKITQGKNTLPFGLDLNRLHF